eukprot:6200500-Pleurochrysis_carterae.AAC.1
MHSLTRISFSSPLADRIELLMCAHVEVMSVVRGVRAATPEGVAQFEVAVSAIDALSAEFCWAKSLLLAETEGKHNEVWKSGLSSG